MIGLQHEMTYRLKVTGPLAATEGSPVGAREYWEMTEGTLRIRTAPSCSLWPLRTPLPGGKLVFLSRVTVSSGGAFFDQATNHVIQSKCVCEMICEVSEPLFGISR
jgi:hypothetical protein